MSNATATVQQPNPSIPISTVSPDFTSHFEVARYLCAITLGGYLWDIAMNLGSDYQLLFKHKIRYPTIVYYLSRVSTLAFILTGFVFEVSVVPNCEGLKVAVGICLTLTLTSTSFLFLLRVIAVYCWNKYIVTVFGLLWLGVVGCTITVPFSSNGTQIKPIMHCIAAQLADFVVGIAIAGMIFDSTVFFAITYRILMNSLVEEGGHAQIRAFFGLGFLPWLSRNLLRSGQYYYLVALCCNIVMAVMLRIPSFPPYDPFHCMTVIPMASIINAMACMVFRMIKLGLITEDGTASGPMEFRAATSTRLTSVNEGHNAIPLHISSRGGDDTPESGSSVHLQRGLDGKLYSGPAIPVDVHIAQERVTT